MMTVAPLVPLRSMIVNMVEERKEEKKDEKEEEKKEEDGSFSIPPPYSLLKMASIGVGTGLMSGFFGVGGGAITVPALSLFLPDECDSYPTIIGTSLMAMVPTSISGIIAHVRKGNVAFRAVAPLAVGSMVGGVIGAKMGLVIDEDILRWGFFLVMLGLGSRTSYSAFRMMRKK